MEQTFMPKHMVLQRFAFLLWERNPMQLSIKSSLNEQYEYESEALSILSRFTEGALHLCEDENLQREIAIGVVKQCFGFWFNEPLPDTLEKVSLDMLEIFKEAHPVPEQAAASEVPSVA